ncbi:MAG: SDR family oxidoreductase [Bdellovibrionales bacterium]|nr:SDR family oxidoreductase [Bdellovibrionales bacterium]
MSTILITGASGGFGHLTVEALLKAGHSVAATMRDIHGRNQAVSEELTRQGAKVIELDVTKDESVQRGVDHALAQLGVIDVVINNAGIGVLGFQECFSSEDFRRIFEINVFGVQRVNRAILPHMKERSQGLLIQISSLLGRIAVPFYGPYQASKWAVEAMAENYRVELSQLGIESCIVEPGGYPTTFIDHLVRPSDSSRSASYGEMSQMPEGFLKGFEKALASNKAQDPKNVATAIAELISKPRGERPFRTVVDKMGMGEHIVGYNEHLDKVTSGIYSAFGIGHLLKVRK